MKHQKTLLAFVMLTSAAVTDTAQATLIDNGNGLLYDNVLNVTWLQDANYAKTSGYSDTGKMDWAAANRWAAQLNFDGLSDWRLATNTPIDGSASYNTNYSANGTTDFGYNITSPKSELAYMYNVNLGLKDLLDATGAYQADFGVFGNGSSGAQANVGLVNNLQDFVYLSGAEYSPGSAYVWGFNTDQGYQYHLYKGAEYYTWAVHPGNVFAVTPVSEPSIVWLLSSGLGLLAFTRRWKNSTVGLVER
jgi:hypothetical protein